MAIAAIGVQLLFQALFYLLKIAMFSSIEELMVGS